MRKQWVILPKENATFVARMEDILDVYHRPYDPLHPVVCLDEQLKQLLVDITEPIPIKAGKEARYDYHYERNGTANLFMVFEPLAGFRKVKVTDRRTKVDFAYVIEELVDKMYPGAEKIVLVMDNLNTHNAGSLYETFEPEKARRLAKKLEIHYTPKSGSWLNMAEIELSILTSQCLDRRIPDKQTLTTEIAAWQKQRNQIHSTVNWQFTNSDARIKLRKLYPSV